MSKNTGKINVFVGPSATIADQYDRDQFQTDQAHRDSPPNVDHVHNYQKRERTIGEEKQGILVRWVHIRNTILALILMGSFVLSAYSLFKPHSSCESLSGQINDMNIQINIMKQVLDKLQKGVENLKSDTSLTRVNLNLWLANNISNLAQSMSASQKETQTELQTQMSSVTRGMTHIGTILINTTKSVSNMNQAILDIEQQQRVQQLLLLEQNTRLNQFETHFRERIWVLNSSLLTMTSLARQSIEDVNQRMDIWNQSIIMGLNFVSDKVNLVQSNHLKWFESNTNKLFELEQTLYNNVTRIVNQIDDNKLKASQWIPATWSSLSQYVDVMMDTSGILFAIAETRLYHNSDSGASEVVRLVSGVFEANYQSRNQAFGVQASILSDRIRIFYKSNVVPPDAIKGSPILNILEVRALYVKM